MLSRNLVKKTLFAPFFLLMVVFAAVFPTAGYSKPITPTSVYIVLTPSWTDTTETDGTDSVIVATVAPKISLNKHVAGFVDSYLEREDEFLQKMKSKSGKYFNTIEKVFDQYGIPSQLKYLAIVESELRANAKSKVGARGMWQFMHETATDLGLRISGKTDDRLHFYRSTVAAAKYLRYLHEQFDDWLLVLAAYNGGPGKVYTAIKKAGSRNFWALQRYLPAESRGHVKRFISIHYFFEGEGSIATQTRAEAKAWQEKVSAEQVVCVQ
jgi:membrane-bound lytic murein transglycosylase D